MTAQQLHDALSHLPEDLIAEADARRSAPPRAIPWHRYAAMAACFGAVLACSLFTLNYLSRGGAKEQAATEVQMAEAVMEYAAAPRLEDAASDMLAQEEMGAKAEAWEEVPAEAAPAEDSRNTVTGAAGTVLYTLTRLSDGQTRILPQANAAVLKDFLSRLTFDPALICNCLAEYRLEIGGEESWEISLTEGFIRNARGQCLLTDIQKEELQAILEEA